MLRERRQKKEEKEKEEELSSETVRELIVLVERFRANKKGGDAR